MRSAVRHVLGLLLMAAPGLLPALASAHSFGKTYALPVPFWLYSYGAAAALVLSFLVAAWLARAPAVAQSAPVPLPADVPPLRGTGWRLWQSISLAGLVVSVAAGLLGSRNPYANISMTWFWVIFLLGTTYLTALIGNGNDRANPWHVLGQWLGRRHRGWQQGRWRYPDWLGYWPALLLYMAVIWAELFAHVLPVTLAWLLLGYTLVTVTGCAAFGSAAWLRHGECFSVFLRLIGLLSCRRDGRWQLPGQDLLRYRCDSLSLLVFLLFMLAATSFDGLHETAFWVSLFWRDGLVLFGGWLTPPLVRHYPLLLDLYLLWQTLWLLLSAFVYLGLFMVCMVWMRRLTASALGVRELALRFAFSLLPIVLVYHLSHYLALLVSQGTQLLPLLSDPLGRGWNLFGTAGLLRVPVTLEAGTVWHLQVVLIVAGHVASVWIAHVEALRLFGSVRLALRSQLPLLLLMVAFTVSGLWILAQPFSPGISLQGLSA